MTGNINNSALISASRTMAGGEGCGNTKVAAQDGENQNPGFNTTDSVGKGNSDDIAALMKEIKSLKKQVKELQAASVKEQAAKPEAEDANSKKSTFSAFTGFISGKIEEMKANSEKRGAEREAALKRERAERDAEEAAILEKERAVKDAALQKEKDKAMAELQFRGKESVSDASLDLIMISESLRPEESLREAAISFMLLKCFHYGDRASAIEAYKYICTVIGDNDKRLEYTQNMLQNMSSTTYQMETYKLRDFYNIE